MSETALFISMQGGIHKEHLICAIPSAIATQSPPAPLRRSRLKSAMGKKQ
jgi:hypothetical protein